MNKDYYRKRNQQFLNELLGKQELTKEQKEAQAWQVLRIIKQMKEIG